MDLPELELITDESVNQTTDPEAMLLRSFTLSEEVIELLNQTHIFESPLPSSDESDKKPSKQDPEEWLEILFPEDNKRKMFQKYLASALKANTFQPITGLWHHQPKYDSVNGLANFLKKHQLEGVSFEPVTYSGLLKVTSYKRALQLNKPIFPEVRDFVWSIKLDPYDEIVSFLLKLYPHEALILGFDLNTGDEDQQHRILEKLSYPCCTCGTRCQEKEIPQILYHGWRERTVAGILEKWDSKSPYKLLSIAALSWMLPYSIYQELREMLNELNALTAQLHEAMLLRQKYLNEGTIGESSTIDCYDEGTVLSLFEELYHYTSHGGSIGSCWLNDRNEVQPPYFVL
jgi:hypothetical protein